MCSKLCRPGMISSCSTSPYIVWFFFRIHFHLFAFCFIFGSCLSHLIQPCPQCRQCPQWLWLFSSRLVCHNWWSNELISYSRYIHIYILCIYNIEICNKILHLNRSLLHLPYSHRTHRHLPDVGCRMSQVSTCVALELAPTSHGPTQNTFRTSKWFVFFCI